MGGVRFLQGWFPQAAAAGGWLLVALWLHPALAADKAGRSPEPAPRYSKAVLIRFDGPIDSMLAHYFFRKLDLAKQLGADLVIVRIDSPGGTVEASFEIAERLRDIRWAHTVAYIPQEALSGASFVALGCDDIIMAPEALLGDAGPIYLDEGAMFRYVPEKFQTNLMARAGALAQAKGRPRALAEAMVNKDLVVYRVENTETGEETFMTQRDLDTREHPDRWRKLEPVRESGGGRFLEVTGTRAVELKLAQGTVHNLNELQKRYGITGKLIELGPTALDTVVYILNLPIVTILLFVVGLVALYVEFHAPGIGVGILVAGLCFALFFWSRFLGGTADWLEVVLFLAGVAFLAAEVFIIPGFGIAGIAGLLLILASLVMSMQNFLIPRSHHDMAKFTNTLLVLMVSAGLFAVAAYYLRKHLGSLPILRYAVLEPPEPTVLTPGASGVAAAGGAPGHTLVAVGEVGIADSPLRPAGKARFGGRFVDVITDGDFVNKGTRVRVVSISGSRVVVAAVDAEELCG